MNFRRYDIRYTPNQYGWLSTEIFDRWRRTATRFHLHLSRDIAIAYLQDLRRQTKRNP